MSSTKTPKASRPGGSGIFFSQLIDNGMAGGNAMLVQAGTPPGGYRTPGGGRTGNTAASSSSSASARKSGAVVRLYDAEAEEKGNFGVRDAAGDAISSISQVMSANRDGGIIVRGGGRDERFVHVQAETGQTTGEWSVEWTPKGGTGSRALAIQTLTPQRRGGQYRDAEAVVQLFGVGGEGSDTIFSAMYDTRVNGDRIVLDNEEAHAFKMKFTACTTTASGYTVTGDHKGNIRLYNSFSRAQAVISQVASGKPVTGIDVTDSGEYVLWTTDDAVYIVHFPDGEESWGKRGEPRPRCIRLTVRDTDLEAILDECEDPTFIPAKFDLESLEEGGTTRVVVAYFGGVFVEWKMREITLAAKRLRERVNEAEDPDTIPVVEVPSSRRIRANGNVVDHTPLRGQRLDAASFADGIQNIGL